MQTTTTNINKKHFPFELSVLLIGHNDDEPRSVEHLHEYTHGASQCNSTCTKIDESDDDNNNFSHSDSPCNKPVNLNKKEINNETRTESITSPIHHHDHHHNTNPHIVPFIVVTQDDNDTTNLESQSCRIQIPSSSSINMDNISLRDYFSPTPCPGSPTLPDKHSTSITTTLSPPGAPLTASATSLASSSKRRGLGITSSGHRASYKRAHTGRLSIDHTPNELFIELQELRQDVNNEYTWHEYARWIRYEEDYDFEMERWQAPRIGCLNFHSLLELRRGLQYGIVLLDLDEQKLERIYEAIINDAIATGQMNKDVKDELLRLLTSNHKHPETRTYRRRSSTIDFPPLLSGRRSSLAFRKNEQINIDLNTRRMSLLESKINGELNKNLKNLIVKYDSIDEKVVTDLRQKNNSGDQLQQNLDNSTESVNQSHRASAPQAFAIRRSVQIPSKKSRESIPYKSDVMRCIPDNAECAEVLIGSMKNLTRPIMAFVRLSEGQLIHDMSEVPLPVKFLFILIGPAMEEYLEIGRALSTLFSTPDFRDTAYQAMDRRDLLSGINDFLSDSIVLPPGDFDKELLLPIIETSKMKKMHAKRHSSRTPSQHNDRLNDPETPQSQSNPKVLLSQLSSISREKQDEDPFKRSGFVFGGVCREMRRRYDHYKSDFMDAFSLNCLVSLIFMFIACLAPALTFGGIIADKTNNKLGVNEMLIASSLNGFLFGFVSGQPLLILGPTGPFLVFEEMVYDLCESLNEDFWTVRCCVSVWTTFFIIILVAFEGSFMIRHVTRFTEEIFALIIAVVYLYEPFKKLYKIFQSNPVRSKYYYDYPLNCFCNISTSLNSSFSFEDTNSSLNYLCYNCQAPKHYTTSSESNYTTILSDETHLPNKALLSLIILLGTCFMSVALKRFRRSNFFGRTTRQTLSDFGMTISLICMVLFDMLITKTAGGHSLTQKITVPDSIKPSDKERGNRWFIPPLRKSLPVWAYFASSFPAILISVVLFFEVELTSIMIQTKLKCVHSSKVIKGTGYHLDILIAGVLISISGLFGLPWICAAPVRSIAHIASLSKYSKTHAPGEKPRLIDIKDQRLTNIGVHILIGCTIFAAPIIRKIPVAALFGIFLYFGFVSIPGTQLFSRLKMMFIPTKYHPNVGYLRRVRQMKRYIYTFIQLIAAGSLITIKVTNFAFLFPFILVLLVPFRKWCLPFIFTDRELTELDGDEEQGNADDETDFYGQVHLPI